MPEGLDQDPQTQSKPTIEEFKHEKLGHPGRDKTGAIMNIIRDTDDVKLDKIKSLDSEVSTKA